MRFGLCLWSLFFSPPSDCSSLPSTMTWAPCPHGVRTRGKKVVRIEESAFRGCQLLNSITAPGCTDFGYKAFAGCSSLQWAHANGGGVNNIGSATKLGHYLFVDCVNLATMTILVLQDGHDPNVPRLGPCRELPTGCLSSTGLKNSNCPGHQHR